MATKDKIAGRKLSLPGPAQELSNASRACKVMGYSRQQFYGIRRNFQTDGAEGDWQDLPADRHRLPFAPCLGQALSKLAVTAARTMNQDALPTFEAHNAKIDIVPPGREKQRHIVSGLSLHPCPAHHFANSPAGRHLLPTRLAANNIS